MLLKMYISLRIKYRYSCHILINLEFFRQISKKYSNNKFHENLSRGNQVISCGWTDGQT